MNDGSTCIIALIEDRKPGWLAMVIGGNSPVYPVGGYDIYVFERELVDVWEAIVL